MKVNEHRHQPNDRRTVYIPIVPKATIQPSNNGVVRSAELIKVYAQPVHTTKSPSEYERKAHSKDWPLVAAPLRETGSALFQAGCAAISAVRTLALKRPRLALYQFLRPLASLERLRLYSAGHLGPSEGGSAQLGLALVLLMSAARTRALNVIATGGLSNQCNRDYDVKISPVSKLRDKLQLVLESAKAGQLPQPSLNRVAPLLLITPKQYEVDEDYYDVIDLPEVKRLREYGIKVEPLEWLSEAAIKVGAIKTHYHVFDLVYQSAAAAFVTGLVIVMGWFSWLNADLPMEFVPMYPNAAAEPFVSCFTPAGGYYPVALPKEGLAPAIPVESTIGWKSRLGSYKSFDTTLVKWDLYSGYYVAIVLLAERSPTKVIVPTKPNSNEMLRLVPGEILKWGWKLNDQVEANRLILIARRNAPFNADQLRGDLIDKFPQASGDGANDETKLDLTAATNYLITLGAGSLTYQFQTNRKDNPCLEQLPYPAFAIRSADSQ